MDADQGTAHDAATAVADEVARRIMTTDRAARRLGIELDAAGPGTATLSMTVQEDMTQGHGTCQGGVTFTLADTAFAVACNSHGDKVVAQHCSISYLAPAQVGDRLVAVAIERSRTGRSGLYDITVTRQDGTVIAEFRGHSRTVGGRWLDAP